MVESMVTTDCSVDYKFGVAAAAEHSSRLPNLLLPTRQGKL